MLVGAKLAVTPLGSPLTDNAIGAANPFIPDVVTIRGIDPPRATTTFVAVSVSANVGTITVTLIVCVLVSPAPTAFKVSVDTPPTAPDAALSVSLLLPVPGDATLVGANVAVTPAGCPLTDRAMADLNPPSADVETVMLVGLPATTVALVALGVIVKLGTVSVTPNVAVRVSPPPVPLMVTAELPAAAPVAALTVAVAGAAAIRVDGENRTVMPDAPPLAVSATGEENPPCAVSVIVAVAELPAATDTLETFGVSVKFALLLSLQWLTSRLASIEPSPVA